MSLLVALVVGLAAILVHLGLLALEAATGSPTTLTYDAWGEAGLEAALLALGGLGAGYSLWRAL